jgi:hypothetical protein
MQATQVVDSANDDFLSKFTDPSYNNPRLQNLGALIGRSRTTKHLESFTAKHTDPKNQIGREKLRITADQRCPNNVDNQPCWSVIADPDLHEQLKHRVDALLRSQNDELYRKKRRVISACFELYLVGLTRETSQPTMVISCISPQDYERVRKLIKRSSKLADYPAISLAATIGSPRSSIALVRLASGSAESEPDRDESPTPGLLRPGTSVWAEVDSGYLLVPATIWIGDRKSESHKAVLGGVVTAERSGVKYGLTVAHAPTGRRIDAAKPTLTESGNLMEPGESGHITDHPQHPTVDSQAAEKYDRIGAIAYSSDMAVGSQLDWALIKFKGRLKLCTARDYRPPSAADFPPDVSTLVDLQAPGKSITGILSPSPTYINLYGKSSSTPTWSVTLEDVISKYFSNIALIDADYTPRRTWRLWLLGD